MVEVFMSSFISHLHHSDKINSTPIPSVITQGSKTTRHSKLFHILSSVLFCNSCLTGDVKNTLKGHLFLACHFI
ncbi:hypothetical protein XENTR_v10021932 [Xenopus tropicalis]|nr:hypothetical protein XENTR_v10021932 [Xenopus tropicalis]